MAKKASVKGEKAISFSYIVFIMDCETFQEGGPIGLVENGDLITIDVGTRTINVELTDQEMEERRKNWTAPAYKANRGVLYKVCE